MLIRKRNLQRLIAEETAKQIAERPVQDTLNTYLQMPEGKEFIRGKITEMLQEMLPEQDVAVLEDDFQDYRQEHPLIGPLSTAVFTSQHSSKEVAYVSAFNKLKEAARKKRCNMIHLVQKVINEDGPYPSWTLTGQFYVVSH